jgi:hypothetical protein
VSADAPSIPTGLEVLQAGGGHGLGNALYLDRSESALLKVYRPRRGSAHGLRESLRSFSHQLFEGKRGTSPRERGATESLVLRLWAVHGYDVPQDNDRPPPPGVTEPTLWLEYCPAKTLDFALAVDVLEIDPARAQVARLAVDQARRHRRAIELSEPLLTMEHATIAHVLAFGDRQVTIDFENAYKRGFAVEEAVARELAGTLRSFFRRIPKRGEDLFRTYVKAYPEREQLRAAAVRTLEGGGVAGMVRRSRDRRRTNPPAKTEVMSRVLSMLSA